MYLDAAIVVYKRKFHTDLEIVKIDALNSPNIKFPLPVISQIKSKSDVTTDFALVLCDQYSLYDIVSAQFLLGEELLGYYFNAELNHTLYNVDLVDLANAVTKAVTYSLNPSKRYPTNFIKRIEKDIINLNIVRSFSPLKWSY